MRGLRHMFSISQPADNLRIIITRHGERTDLALGKQWISKLQRHGSRDPRIPHLPHRESLDEWMYDPPITVNGENQSASVGRKLQNLGYTIDYCYSSPAYRSIQTASKILEGQDRKDVPINIEPGLFECPAWYQGKPLLFMSPYDIASDGKLNVDPSYSPIYSWVEPSEDERSYYERSRRLIGEIVRTHKSEGGTILLSGHAGSIEAVTRGLRGGLFRRRGRAEHLIQESLRVNYCNFAILERDAHTGYWTVQSPESGYQQYPIQLSRHNTIPLYAISTATILQKRKTKYLETTHHLKKKGVSPEEQYQQYLHHYYGHRQPYYYY